VAKHPNLRYFVLKSIIINNLYGVDIMDEAIEICKLRLFLKLVAQVEPTGPIEALPDIDFNIRAGNTLVGYTSLKDVKLPQAASGRLDFDGAMRQIDEKAQDLDHLTGRFRQQQTEIGGEVTAADKAELRKRLKALEDELNDYLAGEYDIKPHDKAKYQSWLASHKPFHWFIESYHIMSGGGFDVIIGNPPYVEYHEVRDEYTVRGYETESCGNLYAFSMERGLHLLAESGRLGFIIPVSSVCTDGYLPLQRLLLRAGPLMISNFNDRPGRLFEGLEHARLSIVLSEKTSVLSPVALTTKYNRWITSARPQLFEGLQYAPATQFVRNGSIPKVPSEVGASILKKALSQTRSVQFYTRKGGRHRIHYTRKLSGFVQILGFVARIYDARGKLREPSELKELSFDTEAVRDAILAVLNSSLFYWLLTLYSDCRNLNRRDVLGMPFDLGNCAPANIKQLSAMAQRLMQDFEKKSKMSEMRFEEFGKMTIQCIYPKLSKLLIDEIDRVLAKHYGFTDEELDFIINYDIKYRMGHEAEEADD
jgi:methylase of polypeptide subunit release factors